MKIQKLFILQMDTLKVTFVAYLFYKLIDVYRFGPFYFSNIKQYFNLLFILGFSKYFYQIKLNSLEIR